MEGDSQILFKRTKSRPGQRTRELPAETDKDAPENSGEVEESPISLAAKLKNKVKRTQPKSRLSFGGDEEEGDGEVFQVKKSNLSRKLKLGKHAASPLPLSLDQATISTSRQGPVYDQAHLSELKASTPTSRPPAVRGADETDMSIDLGDPPITVESIDVFMDGETTIPSESSILSAKQKRERLRAVGPEEDFISLSVTRRDDLPKGPHPESRLVREEDEIGEGDDEFAEYTSAQERIALGKKQKQVEASKRRDAMQEMIADAEEEDEETMDWEQEQLRRGAYVETVTQEPVKEVYKAAPIPPPTNLPTLGSAIDRLSHSLTALTMSHAKNTTAMSSLADEREQLGTRETDLREMISKAEAKRSWFVAFREWVESVATFLDEKFPQVEKLENEHLSLIKERSEMITQRRRADDEDDLSIVFGPLPMAESEPVIDDLGRVVPRANPAVVRQERRAARMARRKGRRAIAIAQGKARPEEEEEEGYSTDSSLAPSDAADYQNAIQKLLSDSKAVFSDVRAEEFKNPSLGLAKWFGEWRDRFGDSYTGAWGGLGLVGAWEFWVRLEILGWNPFEISKSLDAFSWYSSLHEYSLPSVEGEDDPTELGPDGDLVSAMVSTAVVPRICKLVEGGAFDPYSARDIRQMIDLAEQIEASTGASHHKFEMILRSVYAAFESSVIATESLLTPFINLTRPMFDPESVAARERFLIRRIKLLGTLIRWRKYAGEKFGIGELSKRIVVSCIEPVARTGWEVGGQERMRQAIGMLPPELAVSVQAL